MARKIRQRDRNLAGELFAAADMLNMVGRALITPASPEYNRDTMRQLEDQLFSTLASVSHHRSSMAVLAVRAVGGQKV
jgi:hypothetical protein